MKQFLHILNEQLKFSCLTIYTQKLLYFCEVSVETIFISGHIGFSRYRVREKHKIKIDLMEFFSVYMSLTLVR